MTSDVHLPELRTPGCVSRPSCSARRGSALVVALIVVMMVSALGAGFLYVTSSLTRRQTSDVETLRAFYLAEAGLAESFLAVRVGRTGQVGSETEPAACGDGLLWVDATETVDGQVRLESTAMSGRGRATLSLVVEPVEIPLGFFSDEDLVVESVLLVDGFDSGERTYEEEVDAVRELREYVDWLVELVGEDAARWFISRGTPELARELADLAHLDSAQEAELVALFDDLHEAYLAGTLFSDRASEPLPGDWDTTDEVTPTDSDPVSPGTKDKGKERSTSTELSSSESGTDDDPTTTPTFTGAPTATLPDLHTFSDGLLGSNGDVRFTSPSGEPVAIYGDVTPGPEGSVEGLGGVHLTGSSDPREAPVELPTVEVPPVELALPTRHDGFLPMLVPPGVSGHERIEVAADAELVLRGPATVVIGTLVLEPGALLTLDTRDGDVALYVTGGMDLQTGSVVTTSSDFPDELSIQVAAIPTGPDGEPVKLDATSQFHGTIYAPETDVRVGSDFEVFGGIVARRLHIGAGAKLHFDTAKYDSSPIPRVVSWKIIEIPAAVRGRRGDPYAVLGVKPGEVAAMVEAHDLAAVFLTIEYRSTAGVLQSYSGTEDLFDWELVAEVVDVGRDPTRKKEEGVVDPVDPVEPVVPPPTEDPLEPARDWVLDGIATKTGGELKDWLLTSSPINDAEFRELIDADKLASTDLYMILEKNGPDIPGFPSAEGTKPLSDAVLLAAIGANMTSQHISWALEQNSPLSPAVLQAAIDRNPPLQNGDMSRVMNAQ